MEKTFTVNIDNKDVGFVVCYEETVSDKKLEFLIKGILKEVIFGLKEDSEDLTYSIEDLAKGFNSFFLFGEAKFFVSNGKIEI